MLKIFYLILSLIVTAGIIVVIAGGTAEPKYQGELAFELSYPISLVWQELLNINEVAKRKTDVESVQILEEFGKLSAWQENLKNGGYRIYRMNKREEEKKLVLELTESSYGLTGIWTFELEKNANDTTVYIYEESTLTDIKRRGYRTILGRRGIDLIIWQKYLKTGLFQALLKTQ
jgi:hypothetical protein